MKEQKEYKFIGLCLTRIQEYLENDFFHSAVKRAVEKGYKLLVFNAFDDFFYSSANYAKGERYIYDIVPYEQLEGLIVLSETIKDEELLKGIISKAREHGIFTVCVDKPMAGCCNITYNYKSAFEEIVRHIVRDHGCRTINLVAGIKDNAFSEERIECCRRIMAKAGIELDERRLMYGNFWSGPTIAAFDEFVKTGLPMPDAFICCNDSMAMTICTKLKEMGLSVPADVIVTGFDGIYEEQYHMPRLTTAKQDVAKAGMTAVDVIDAHVRGEKTQDSIVIDHQVIISHSCGCKRIDYREATGQITPLFEMIVSDRSYDTYMFEFNSAAAVTKNIDDFSEMILKHNTFFGYYYYALCINRNFLTLNSGEEQEGEEKEKASEDERFLILCESEGGVHYKPRYGKGPEHFGNALRDFNVFLYWSVHFQEKSMGYGVTGISTGCDGHNPNDETRHIHKYTRNLNQVLETASDQYALKQAIARLQDLYIRDHITGLYNRRGFYSEIHRYIEEALSDKETRWYLIIISVDMDGLKFINDTYGHAEGDAAIKACADALKSVWTEHVICSRFGGDEFTVAGMCRDNPHEWGGSLVKNIDKFLEDFNASSGKPYKVRASYGLMSDTVTADFHVDNLIKAADDLMYKEKLSHKESRARSCTRPEGCDGISRINELL